MKKNLPLIILAVIIIAAGSFYGGMVFGKNQKIKNLRGDLPNFSQQGRQGLANRQQGNFINGEIIAKDDKSLTIKLPTGGSKIIIYSASSQISKSASGTIDDLSTGTNIMVTGTTNADGSLTAQNIQIRPAGWQANNANNTPAADNPLPTNTNN